MSSADPRAQLEEKVRADIAAGLTYDSLQYIQSFVSRKSKSVGTSVASDLVFLGAKLLIDSGAAFEAGTLLVWFIEDGAAVGYQFHLEAGEVSGDKYCDAQRLLSLLSQYAVDKVASFVDRIYNPLHLLIVKKNCGKTGPLADRLHALEETFANVFEGSKRWGSAFKVVARLGDADRLAKVVNTWSGEGYKTEKPLFFARSIFILLADKKVEMASKFLLASSSYISDNATGASVESCMESALAVYHLSSILTNLAAMPPMPRVDKKKLFSLLMQLYIPIISYCDLSLSSILEKIGTHLFEFVSPQAQQQQASNPMDIMKAMFAASGGGGGVGGKGNLDYTQLLSKLGQLGQLSGQQQSKPRVKK